MSEQYRQYLNQLHGFEFTVTTDPNDVNVIRYFNEPNHIVVTARADEIAPGVVVPTPHPVNHNQKDIKTMLSVGFGIGFAVGMFVATASIYLFGR